jgi:hypothetical protein
MKRLLPTMAVEPYLRLALLTRYSLVCGLIAPVLIPLAAYFMPELLGSLLVLEDPRQLFHVTWLSLLMATFVLVSFRVTQVNAVARFADYRVSFEQRRSHSNLTPDEEKLNDASGNPGWRWRWVLFLAMGWSLPLWCIACTLGDLSPRWPGTPSSVAVLAGLVVLGGTMVALVVLMFLTAAQQLLLDPAAVSVDLLPLENWQGFARLKQIRVPGLNRVGRKVAAMLRFLGPGYTQPRGDFGEVVLSPGHAQLTLWLAIILAFYLYSFFDIHSRRHVPSEHGHLCALFFVLVLLLFIHLVLAGVAFLVDYWRMPVSIVLLLASFASTTAFDSDHVYQLNPDKTDQQPAVSREPADLKLSSVFDEWPFPKRTLVMVSAAGGGIQASAWTVQVLTGLDELYGTDFTRSIGVVSGASGGSVGAMFYLAGGNWSGTGPPFDDAARNRTNHNAAASSLEAAAWGIAYPDLIRSFAPFLVRQDVDRGWAIERAWESRMGQSPTLGDWSQRIAAHEMPVPIFNATLAETGQRLVISPVVDNPGAAPTAAESCEFFNLYSRAIANPRVTTAARLSATFPYVSPICRPDDTSLPVDVQYHVADGGYTENGAIFTLLKWAQKLVARYGDARQRPFDRIVIVRILPFPASDKPQPAKADQGWTYEVLGPIDTMSNVRTASQTERNDFDLDLVVSSENAGATSSNKIPILVAPFEFRPSGDYTTPLSWHLTTSQKKEIRETWQSLVAHSPKGATDKTSGFEVLDRYFNR